MPPILRSGTRSAWRFDLGIGGILSLIALVCGVLLLIPGAVTGLPLVAIAIICLALVQSGLLGRLRG